MHFQAPVSSLLQSQFGVGLREAAHNLRICPTTLKRACRRHGIYRWPRRQSWGGGPGDAGRTESMNLDGDSVSSAGLHAGCDQPGVLLPAQGSIAIHCHLELACSGCSNTAAAAAAVPNSVMLDLSYALCHA